MASLPRSPLSTERLELVGVHEAAAMLGISKSALAERRRSESFPEPLAELRCGPIWLRSEVEAYKGTFRPDPGGWNSYRERISAVGERIAGRAASTP